MSHFNSLTDIVTCNLTSILRDADDPVAMLDSLIAEMQTGVSSARRCVETAERNEQRIRDEINEYNQQLEDWKDDAKSALNDGDENRARVALIRKREVDDLIAALEQEYVAARNTRDHLTTVMHAISARLADARRRRTDQPDDGEPRPDAAEFTSGVSSPVDQRDTQIEQELSALRAELGKQH